MNNQFFLTSLLKAGVLSFLLLMSFGCQKEQISTISNSEGHIDIRAKKLQGAKVRIKVILDGCFDGSAMSPDLFNLGYVPNVPQNVGTVIDWVTVQIRSGSPNGSIVETQGCLLKPNGNAIGVNGSTYLNFDLDPGEYYVSVNHRNHLGTVIADPVYLTNDTDVIPPLVDFTDEGTQVYEIPSSPSLSAQRRNNEGIMTLWSGDACSTSTVSYQGPGNGTECIFELVMAAPGNSVPPDANYIVNGYHNEDVNMDGSVIFQGPNNDRSIILFNTVLIHPGNVNYAIHYIVIQAMN